LSNSIGKKASSPSCPAKCFWDANSTTEDHDNTCSPLYSSWFITEYFFTDLLCLLPQLSYQQNIDYWTLMYVYTEMHKIARSFQKKGLVCCWFSYSLPLLHVILKLLFYFARAQF
jgi:hypothetical protein